MGREIDLVRYGKERSGRFEWKMMGVYRVGIEEMEVEIDLVDVINTYLPLGR